MQVVVPMSGRGSRFVRAGFREIKPLIEVDGMPIIEHVVAMYPGETDFLFICARDHLEETPLRSVLSDLVPQGIIAVVEPHKLGPVHTVLEAREFVRNDTPVVVNYCDFSVTWDYSHFKRTTSKTGCDGCITAYRGFHPHSLGPNLYAYMREKNGRLLEIREKGSFTDDRMNEFASAGTYYFRTGQMLIHYFERAYKEGLTTGGEYYASLPYNLLLEDGLDVLVYELEHFLQWGTPEDLEEYKEWSDYFTHWASWVPAARQGVGEGLVPMAGEGLRFVREQYEDPKPLIPVSGRPMVDRSMGSFPPCSRWITLCLSSHLEDPRLVPALERGGRKVQVMVVEQPTEGQASTCLLARDQLDMETPLFIGPCDAGFVYHEGALSEALNEPGIDCLVWTFRDHPHANRNPEQYGWVQTDIDGSVTGVSCKKPLGEDVSGDPGVTGAFWFRKARYFLEAADAMIAADARINGEFYVDLAIDFLVGAGRRACVFDVIHYICFGTPDDVRTFEYWERYFSIASHHPYTVSEGGGPVDL
ncbi:MAG: NTP transferase domain-containing protein [bacterium]|nr:NTP transferase domain-containing protein [bacterium]